MRLPRSEGIVFCVAFLVESLSIIIGNLLVIVAFTSSRRLRKRKHYFLINLAFSDFLIGALSVPLAFYGLAVYFDLWYVTSNKRAKATLFFTEALFCFSSLLNLAAVGLERMYATMWPMRHRALASRTYRVLIAFVWIISAGIAAFEAYVRSSTVWDPTLHLMFVLIVSCILLTVCVSYSSIWLKFKFGKRPANNVSAAQERKLTVSLLIVTVVSLITSLPYSLLFASLPEGPTSGLSYNNFVHLVYVFSLLFYVNPLVNPVVYIFRMPQFRKAVSVLLHRKRFVQHRADRT